VPGVVAVVGPRGGLAESQGDGEAGEARPLGEREEELVGVLVRSKKY
jgi:hypothetical protein